MTPSERAEMERLKQQVRDLEQATNPLFLASLARVLTPFIATVQPGASTVGTAQAVRNAIDTGSETVADTYTGVLTLKDNRGNTYRIGYYS